ncbi:DNA-processing protein DprA [Hyalangium rubrum]|uniref:DNA-processing protein DprA n=1 Tax=Hyalangium rubrum TaxID=3103134 RepID=A0ABU5H5N8_9BACT|nr:DNA-processing protein DprA [Hyalangium sp. s54d21]MDY7228571.1 DNA-processing protein DprA [Hyalangium sp. s54d21]
MMAPHDLLSPDTQVTLLLCGHFPGNKDESNRPLALIEYNRLAKELLARSLRPADLLSNVPEGLSPDFIAQERLNRLLRRGAALALATERWSQSGIGVLGRSDSAYPVRLRTILKSLAPPILFFAGNTELLGRDAVCVVGSRDATPSGLRFARTLGAACAEEGLAVVSGDARGVDREAMSGALEAGGRVVGVLSDGLGKAILSKRNRQELMKGTLALVSPFSPEAPFTVAHAMDRNKYLYALSLAAVVVDSDTKGGTWSGAVENHKHGWVPASVRVGNNVREGNHKLADLGLSPLTEEELAQRNSLRTLLTRKATKRTASTTKIEPSNLLLFGTLAPSSTEADRSEHDLPSPLEPPLEKPPEEITSEPQSATGHAWSRSADDLFEFFLAQLTPFIETEPRSEQQVAEYFAIECVQARRWLEKACEQHRLARKGSPPQYALERLPH